MRDDRIEQARGTAEQRIRRALEQASSMLADDLRDEERRREASLLVGAGQAALLAAALGYGPVDSDTLWRNSDRGGGPVSVVMRQLVVGRPVRGDESSEAHTWLAGYYFGDCAERLDAIAGRLYGKRGQGEHGLLAARFQHYVSWFNHGDGRGKERPKAQEMPTLDDVAAYMEELVAARLARYGSGKVG